MESIISFIAEEYKEDIKCFKTINCIGLLMRSVLYDTIKIVNERFTDKNAGLMGKEEISLTKEIIRKKQEDGKLSKLINIISNDGTLVVTSREVALNFEKQHKDVLEAIRVIIGQMSTAENSALYFIPSEYKASNGKLNPEYLLTRDGFSLLVMGFTGAKALEWKLKYIEAFNKMEEELKQKMIDTSQLSPELQMFNKLFNALAENELEKKKMRQELTETKQQTAAVKEEVQSMRDVIALNPNSWRSEVSNLLNKMAKQRGGTQEAYKEVRDESYKLLNGRAGAKLDIRLTNRRRKVLEETGSKSKADKVSKLDVIADDKRLTEVYIAIVKEMAIKYKVA